MLRTCKRAAAAAVSAVLCALLLTSAPAVSAESDLSDLNGDGVIDVFDYVLSKRDSVDASAPLNLSVGSQEGEAGSVVTIPVGISDNTGCLGVNLVFDYSPELIPAAAEGEDSPIVVQSDVLSAQRPQVMIFEESATLLYSSTTFKQSDDNGVLFTVSFEIPENATPGTTYTFLLRQHDIVDADYNTLALLTERGRITVTEPPAVTEPIVTEPPVVTTAPIQTEPPVTTPYVRTGIDISTWQGDVDMAKLPSNVSFVMVRAGYGKLVSQEDKRFAANYDKAKAAGIPVGAYWYSYAMTPDEARTEARACLQVLGNRTFEYPIAYDVEESKQLALGKEQVSAIICAFCEELEAAGYYVSVYMSASPLSTTVNQTVKDRYDVWVAHYNVAKPAYSGTYGMWQYSSTGTVSGISGAVDMNYSYRNYPEIMTRVGLNGY